MCTWNMDIIHDRSRMLLLLLPRDIFSLFSDCSLQITTCLLIHLHLACKLSVVFDSSNPSALFLLEKPTEWCMEDGVKASWRPCDFVVILVHQSSMAQVFLQE